MEDLWKAPLEGLSENFMKGLLEGPGEDHLEGPMKDPTEAPEEGIVVFLRRMQKISLLFPVQSLKSGQYQENTGNSKLIFCIRLRKTTKVIKYVHSYLDKISLHH